mmetsp:Transcript_20387/g.56391  ORF Transcript_20387/g.56391 Transcript_20387/m.56391 type:complete len:215 (+) Transcript_20387:375-1019(+)
MAGPSSTSRYWLAMPSNLDDSSCSSTASASAAAAAAAPASLPFLSLPSSLALALGCRYSRQATKSFQRFTRIVPPTVMSTRMDVSLSSRYRNTTTSMAVCTATLRTEMPLVVSSELQKVMSLLNARRSKSRWRIETTMVTTSSVELVSTNILRTSSISLSGVPISLCVWTDCSILSIHSYRVIPRGWNLTSRLSSEEVSLRGIRSFERTDSSSK